MSDATAVAPIYSDTATPVDINVYAGDSTHLCGFYFDYLAYWNSYLTDQNVADLYNEVVTPNSLSPDCMLSGDEDVGATYVSDVGGQIWDVTNPSTATPYATTDDSRADWWTFNGANTSLETESGLLVEPDMGTNSWSWVMLLNCDGSTGNDQALWAHNKGNWERYYYFNSGGDFRVERYWNNGAVAGTDRVAVSGGLAKCTGQVALVAGTFQSITDGTSVLTAYVINSSGTYIDQITNAHNTRFGGTQQVNEIGSYWGGAFYKGDMYWYMYILAQGVISQADLEELFDETKHPLECIPDIYTDFRATPPALGATRWQNEVRLAATSPKWKSVGSAPTKNG